MKRISAWDWKRIGRSFAIYLPVCLFFSWLESNYWLDEPRTAWQIIFKGLFMTIWFTGWMEIVFSGRLKREKQDSTKTTA